MKCRIPDCCNSTSRWGAYCNAHKSRKRRHGHPLQETITAADLAPFVKVVRARRLRNPEADAWRILAARWTVLMDCCQGIVDVYMSGVPGQGHQVQAAREVLMLSQHVEANDVIDVLMAMYLLQDARPKSFKSDVAFVHQIVRRVRGLTEVNAGSWFDHSTGRVKRVYRELSPRTAVEMGALLVQALGAGGLHMVKLEHRDRDRKKAEAHELHRAMDALS
jgi:hypothetical protein